MQCLYRSCPPNMRKAIQEREPRFRSASATPEQRRVFLDGLKSCAEHAIASCNQRLGSSRAAAPAQAPASPPPEPPTPAWASKTTAPAPAESGPEGVVEYEEFECVPHTASTPNVRRYDLPTNLFLEPQRTALDVRAGDVVTLVLKEKHRRQKYLDGEDAPRKRGRPPGSGKRKAPPSRGWRSRKRSAVRDPTLGSDESSQEEEPLPEAEDEYVTVANRRACMARVIDVDARGEHHVYILANLRGEDVVFHRSFIRDRLRVRLRSAEGGEQGEGD